MQHTHGPWEARGYSVWSVVPAQKCYGPSIVAHTNSGAAAINLANARLIAAAPELLAMCQSAYDILEGQDDGLLLMFRDDLRDVIKKATGK